MIAGARRALWVMGWPARGALIGVVVGYRATLGRFTAGRCRFYPSCSEYAMRAIRDSGALRGVALTVWRVARCSPLSGGGVDHPPARRVYDTAIQGRIS